MMLRSYHGRVVPATTHRVAEVRSNQKDDTLAHGKSRLVKAVEALRCGKIIALPTVRRGFFEIESGIPYFRSRSLGHAIWARGRNSL